MSEAAVAGMLRRYQRLDELRTKLRRIDAHKELSPKQEQAALELVREIIAIEGADGKGKAVAELVREIAIEGAKALPAASKGTDWVAELFS